MSRRHCFVELLIHKLLPHPHPVIVIVAPNILAHERSTSRYHLIYYLSVLTLASKGFISNHPEKQTSRQEITGH